VVDALERIHAALDEGGVVVDTQPVSARPPVFGTNGRLGTLDMREWAKTIAAVDARIVETIDRGLFSVAADEHVVVTDVYDDLAELVEVTGEWAGTRVPRELARRADAASGAVELHQDVRVRVLARG
jgi:hypothetical protein